MLDPSPVRAREEPRFALFEMVKLAPTGGLYPRDDEDGARLEPGALGTICDMGKATTHVRGRLAADVWVYWVEFTDDAGKTLAVLPLVDEDLEKA